MIDLLVVGGGTAGIVGAKTAARLGARVVLAERARTGGDCLWTGCVPSKSLLAAAHAAADARAAARFGIHVEGVDVDFAQVMRHVQDAIAAIAPVDSPAALRAAGVDVRAHEAVFIAADRALVGGQEIVFGQAVIATGSAPAVPRELAGCHTTDTIWTLTERPDRLVVVGGGSIGCELGQAFARLGSHVTIIEQGPRLLGTEDPAAAGLVHAALESDGVDVRLGRTVRSVAGSTVLLDNGVEVGADVVLAAVGRRPRTAGLGLGAAGVGLDDAGYVRVDEHLRTGNPRIWAAGDVTPLPQFTHAAGMHASLAASNAVLGLRRRIDVDTIPRVTFTRPEVAAFGLRAERSITLSHEHVDRAVAEADTSGFTRLDLDRRGRVVGATVVGPRAGEALAELVLAARQGLRARDLAGSMHAYPTWADGPWNAAIELAGHDLDGRIARLGVRALSRLRRARLSR